MEYTFKQLRKIAINEGIRDSRLHIAIWLQHQGYIKLRRQINRIKHTYYIKPCS